MFVRSLGLLFARSLWGNRADLSVTAGAVDAGAHDEGDRGSHVLADDTPRLLRLLHRRRGGRVVLVADNCGLELLADLVLIDALLRTGAAGAVTIHVKARARAAARCWLAPWTSNEADWVVIAEALVPSSFILCAHAVFRCGVSAAAD